MKVKVNQDYSSLRKLDYPSLADQLDLLYHGGVEAWREEIKKVKERYPKPNDQP